MAKRTARRAASSSAASGKLCAFCGEKGCSCMKMASGAKVICGLLLVGFAAGMLSINLVALILGLGSIAIGAMLWTKA